MSVIILNNIYCVKTTFLQLNDKQLTTLPAEIVNLTNLQTLRLSRNLLTTLPAEIGNLTKLKYLNLYNNHLTSLLVEIGNLTNLQTLYLNNNQLTTLPVEIGNLTNLNTLYLYNNQLTTLRAEILKIKNIRWLVINETSYDINKMKSEIDFLIFTELKTEITNLPIYLKEVWLKKGIPEKLVNKPFGCKINFF